MAEAACRAQAAVSPHDRSHDLVGMKASFHQRFGLARSDESDCFICRIVAVRRVD
jgi:hypothetical protein